MSTYNDLIALVRRASTDSTVTCSDNPGCFYCDCDEDTGHTADCPAAKALAEAEYTNDPSILPALRAAYEEIEYAPPNLIDTGDMYAEGIVEGHGDALEILKKHLGPWLGEEKETP